MAKKKKKLLKKKKQLYKVIIFEERESIYYVLASSSNKVEKYINNCFENDETTPYIENGFFETKETKEWALENVNSVKRDIFLEDTNNNYVEI